ncbi:MAG: hypothetical protein KC441_03100 [Anaerolineales bacterium]|nr:hypothetical protein [Anaerolineales bacterium]
MGITNSWAAYQFDSAVLTAGLDRELAAINASRSKSGGWSGKSGRNGRQLSTGSLPKKSSGYQSLKTAVGPNIRKIAIPEDGIW